MISFNYLLPQLQRLELKCKELEKDSFDDEELSNSLHGISEIIINKRDFSFIEEKILALDRLRKKFKHHPTHPKDTTFKKLKGIKENFNLILFIKDAKEKKELSEEKFNEYLKTVSKIDQTLILDNLGNNLILLCAQSTNLQFRKLAIECLNHGADPNSRNQSGRLPLHYACNFEDLTLIEHLLANNADVTCKEASPHPTQLALRKTKGAEILRLFATHGLDPNFTLSGTAFWIYLMDTWENYKQNPMLRTQNEYDWVLAWILTQVDHINEKEALLARA